jgi:DNA-binding beta-propeller fold protein YncE
MRPVLCTRVAILLAIALVAPAAANESGEIWITAQNTHELKILSGNGHIETVPLPDRSQPHTITFSPDGSYAYISNLGDGNLLVARTQDRQVVTTINLGPDWTHHTQPSPDGSILLSANPMTGMLTKIAADEDAETWTPVAAMNMKTETGTGLGPVCVAFRPDGQRAYVSLFGPWIAVVDVPTMTLIRTIPLIGGIACGLVNSKDGRTIYVISAGGTGHFYRLDMTTDTLTEDTNYGPIASGIHGLIVSANEKRAYITAPGSEVVKVLNLNGSDVSTISLDFTPGVLDAPDSFARKGSYLYVALRFAGQLARINTQTGDVDYLSIAPPATSGWALHGMAVRP